MQLGLLCFLQQKQKGWELVSRLLCVSCFKAKKSWGCRKKQECSTENLNTVSDKLLYSLSPLLVLFHCRGCYLTVPSPSLQPLPASLNTKAAPTTPSQQPQKSPALLLCQTHLSTSKSPLSPSQWHRHPTPTPSLILPQICPCQKTVDSSNRQHVHRRRRMPSGRLCPGEGSNWADRASYHNWPCPWPALHTWTISSLCSEGHN